MNLIKKIAKLAREYFKTAKGSHDFDHTLRVYQLCLHLGKKEKANLEILKIAALLHDIGREEEDSCRGKICHAAKGAVLAQKILQDLKVDSKKIDQVFHCIETHRFRGSKKPESKEAKILFDADKLDSIGAIGVARAFLFAGEIGAKLHEKDIIPEKIKQYSRSDSAYREYLVKLKKVKTRMLTKEGKRLAKVRHAYMQGFFERLNREISGDF